MWSEHAGYGSSRWYLKTLLSTNGFNHLAGIGAEAAATVFYVDPETKKTFTLVYSSESHNGPSFVCAHPGATTGTGGNERDNIALTANLPFALYESRRQCHPLHNPHNDPVRQHTDETTKGVGDYGNAMGIPHGDGSIKYDPRYAGNNLVNVMCTSVAEKGRLMTNKAPALDNSSKLVGIYIGKASDKTGIGGTKFASKPTDMTDTAMNEKAVQDPDPHLQWNVTQGIEKLVDLAIKEGWKDQVSIKDMGAAGLLCSTVEQLHDGMGVIINGDLVPQNEPRNAMELLEAETQERFFVYVHEDHAQKVLDIFNEDIDLPHINKGSCAKIVARCNDSGNYTFTREGKIEVDIPVKHLEDAPLIPHPIRAPKSRATPLPKYSHLKIDIMSVLKSINFKSDKRIYQHYDSHVQGTNIVNRGEGPATLRTHPDFKGKVGQSVSFDSNTVYGLLDPKFQAIDSFIRGAYKMATVGCSVIGATNNANYGRTDVPEEMWEFVKGQEGVGEVCHNWQLENDYIDMIMQDPEIAEKAAKDPRRNVTVNSGNVSLNKANANTGTAIPPTTILGLPGWTNAPDKYATWNLEAEDSDLYLIGARQKALGGTDFLQTSYGPKCLGDKLFDIDYETTQKEVNAMIQAVRKGYVTVANSIEEGGLCNAIAEMVANTDEDVDVTIELERMMGESKLNLRQKLFSESYGFVVQLTDKHKDDFFELMEEHGVQSYWIGKISPDIRNSGPSLNFKKGNKSHSIPTTEVKELYHPKLDQMLEAA